MAQIQHREQHHWRLLWAAHSLDEPGHEVSIREAGQGAIALQICDQMGGPLRSVDLRGGWHPIAYRCRSFNNPVNTRCLVFGRALPLDNGVQVELECVLNGQLRSTVPAEFIDELAIATQVLKVKG